MNVSTKETMPKYEELVENGCSPSQTMSKGLGHTAPDNARDGGRCLPEAGARYSLSPSVPNVLFQTRSEL